LIYFLVDSSAVWRLQRQPELTEAWSASLLSGAVGSCEPQRAEFRRPARNADEFDQMNQTFHDVYPDVPVPKSVWRWMDSAQHRLASAGAVVLLHDDADYELAERHLPDVRARRVVSPDH
jgi:predicted nucleic acid-binding protein